MQLKNKFVADLLNLDFSSPTPPKRSTKDVWYFWSWHVNFDPRDENAFIKLVWPTFVVQSSKRLELTTTSPSYPVYGKEKSQSCKRDD